MTKHVNQTKERKTSKGWNDRRQWNDNHIEKDVKVAIIHININIDIQVKMYKYKYKNKSNINMMINLQFLSRSYIYQYNTVQGWENGMMEIFKRYLRTRVCVTLTH